jgi:hypothetical protein
MQFYFLLIASKLHFNNTGELSNHLRASVKHAPFDAATA